MDFSIDDKAVGVLVFATTLNLVSSVCCAAELVCCGVCGCKAGLSPLPILCVKMKILLKIKELIIFDIYPDQKRGCNVQYLDEHVGMSLLRKSLSS